MVNKACAFGFAVDNKPPERGSFAKKNVLRSKGLIKLALETPSQVRGVFLASCGEADL